MRSEPLPPPPLPDGTTALQRLAPLRNGLATAL